MLSVYIIAKLEMIKYTEQTITRGDQDRFLLLPGHLAFYFLITPISIPFYVQWRSTTVPTLLYGRSMRKQRSHSTLAS
jgi:hypothetical protein